MVNWEKIRKEFPILRRQVNKKPLVYLDSAATSQKPRVVIDAIADFYCNHNANVHRAKHTLSEEASNLFDEGHELAADLVNAYSMQEIVLTRNATEAINLVSFGLKKKGFFKKGDEILVSGMEHHANLVPWIVLAEELDLKLKVIPLSSSMELDLDAAEKMISKKTRLVAVSHASNVLGTINDVRQLSRLAHDYGGLCLVDACQSVPHFPVDVRKIGCDFLTWSSHKMCGPTGVGLLWGRQDVLSSLPPFLTGGEMISEVFWDRATYNSLPWRFEAGTMDIAGMVGFGAAVEFLQGIGFDEISKRDSNLGRAAHKALSQLPGVKVLGPKPEKKVSIFSFTVDGVHPHDVATVLDSDGIAIRSGNHCAQPLLRDLGFDAVCRASFYFYNSFDEVDKLVEGIEKTQRIFKVGKK
ncbi:MAG: SufS family cysteine desulfurase [Candidatus Diapherotrites archaeon]|uniref:Cysteine desulfurase n=1 Tax=Candidatus Iainarchaeum sp. TaxID=3101447 RepID=A0A8T4LDY0_9ARCH|nr:SufS family cysteine desulfurase [Candidatus Diapherotrites archaeon]